MTDVFFFIGLWKSHDNLAEESSKTDTAGESHDSYSNHLRLQRTPSKPDNQPPSMSSLKRAESAHVSSGSRAQRVVGRREQSKSPDRKPEIKTPIAPMPLKSAMRQPRTTNKTENMTCSGPRLYRSNSLPRDSKSDFSAIKGSAEPKKQVKTVRYDENVKSAEIAQDLPPSLSPAQVDEVILPAKREAPIGGHDENFSETIPTSVYAYQNASGQGLNVEEQRDLRESIVSARNELLSRNKYEVTSVSSNSRQQKSTILQPSEEPRQVPFTHYTSGYGRQTSQPNFHTKSSSYGSAYGFSYSTSSLPRQQRNSDSSVTPQHSSVRVNPPRQRAPLPSYEEIQSSRSKPNFDIRLPPHYQTKNSSHPPQPNYQTKGSPLLYSRPAHEHLTHDSPLSADTTNTGSCSSSNPDSGYGGNFYDSSKPSAEYNSWYQQNLQTTAIKMSGQQICNKPAAPVHEHSRLKQQQLYSADNERQRYTADLDVSSSATSHAVNNAAVTRQTHKPRTVYTNMISDV